MSSRTSPSSLSTAALPHALTRLQHGSDVLMAQVGPYRLINRAVRYWSRNRILLRPRASHGRRAGYRRRWAGCRPGGRDFHRERRRTPAGHRSRNGDNRRFATECSLAEVLRRTIRPDWLLLVTGCMAAGPHARSGARRCSVGQPTACGLLQVVSVVVRTWLARIYRGFGGVLPD